MSAQREQMFTGMPDAKQFDPPAGWHSRGYLPHYDGGEIPQFITFRLADSLPQARWTNGEKNFVTTIATAMQLFASELNFILIRVTANVVYEIHV
jgi:hypothetical protein